MSRQNAEGISVSLDPPISTYEQCVLIPNSLRQPAQYLEDEDFPAVAAYLRSIEGTATPGAPPAEMHEQPSQHAQNVASENLTSSLLQSVQTVMQRAEAEGREVPEEELRQIVGRAVIEGVITGYGMGAEAAADQGVHEQADSGDAAKRPRTEGG